MSFLHCPRQLASPQRRFHKFATDGKLWELLLLECVADIPMPVLPCHTCADTPVLAPGSTCLGLCVASLHDVPLASLPSSLWRCCSIRRLGRGYLGPSCGTASASGGTLPRAPGCVTASTSRPPSRRCTGTGLPVPWKASLGPPVRPARPVFVWEHGETRPILVAKACTVLTHQIGMVWAPLYQHKHQARVSIGSLHTGCP